MDTFTLCPNCTDRIPLLLLERDNKINIFCDCGYANMLPLHEYLTLYSTRSITNAYVNQCPIHNMEFLAYCLTCGIHVCSFCLEQHEEHLKPDLTFYLYLILFLLPFLIPPMFHNSILLHI